MLEGKGKVLDLQDIRRAKEAVEVQAEGMGGELGVEAGTQATEGDQYSANSKHVARGMHKPPGSGGHAGPQDWQELTGSEGAHGPRTYQFARLRVWESRAGVPGRPCWLVLRRNLDGTELKACLANAPADTELQALAQVSAWRWPVATEFQTTKSETGLDEYEVRS